MNVQDIITISFGGITDRKFRFALNLLGILIGCAAVTGLISVTQGMNTEISGQLDILGANSLTVMPTTGEEMSMSSGPPSSMIMPLFLSWREIELIEGIPGIESVAPVQRNFGSYTITGNTRVTTIMGMGTNLFDINPSFEVEYGRAFTRSDKAVAVIGSNVAHPDSETEPILEVGDRLKITTIGAESNEITLRIIGITEDSGMSMSMSPDDAIMIPLRTSEILFGNAGNYDLALVKISDVDESESITFEIEEKIEDVQVISAASAQEMIGEVTGTIESVLSGIAAISLVVAGVGIVNTMTVSVSERTKEIGTMKAIGAKNTEILMLFLAESGYTGLAGGILGGAFGFLLGITIGNFIGLPVALDFGLWGMVILFALLTSLVAGAWPAWSAAKLNPVEAFRHE